MQPCFISVAPASHKCRASKRLLCLQSICIRRLRRLHCCKKIKSLQNYPLYDKLAITTTKWLLEVPQCVNLKIPNKNFLLIVIISMHQSTAVLMCSLDVERKLQRNERRSTVFAARCPDNPHHQFSLSRAKKRRRSIKITSNISPHLPLLQCKRVATNRRAGVAASTGIAAGAIKATSLLWTVAEASACTYRVRKWKLRHFVNVMLHIYIWLYAMSFDWTFVLTVQAVQV